MEQLGRVLDLVIDRCRTRGASSQRHQNRSDPRNIPAIAQDFVDVKVAKKVSEIVVVDQIRPDGLRNVF